MIQVSIVEDTTDIREALQFIVSSSGDMQCTHAIGSAEEALKTLPLHCPDIVLMDIHLPGMNGIDCIRQLTEFCPNTQFLMCTVYEDDEHIVDALKAGATGYIVKKTPADKLLAAIRELHEGGSPMSASIARKVITSFKNTPSQKTTAHLEELSQREVQLLTHLSQGLMYKEIADLLNISLDTVKKHCHNIYGKLQVNSRTEAINKAFPRN